MPTLPVAALFAVTLALAPLVIAQPLPSNEGPQSTPRPNTPQDAEHAPTRTREAAEAVETDKTKRDAASATSATGTPRTEPPRNPDDAEHAPTRGPGSTSEQHAAPPSSGSSPAVQPTDPARR